MKKHFATSLLAAGILALSGCGGSSSSSTDTTTSNPDLTNAKVGYYVDDPVAGLDYNCNGITGTTGPNGEFNYIPGTTCTFSLGDVPVRQIGTEGLSDTNPYFIETDGNIAAVLQTIDADGDPTNGISITPEVKTAFIEAVKQLGKQELPKPDELNKVVETIRTKVETFNGNVISPDEALARVAQTQADVKKLVEEATKPKVEEKPKPKVEKKPTTKEKVLTADEKLLAGKTFYHVQFYSGNGDYLGTLKKVVVNSNATQLTEANLDGSSSITKEIKVANGKLYFIENGTAVDKGSFDTTTNTKSLHIGDEDFFYTQSDAQSWMNTDNADLFTVNFFKRSNNKVFVSFDNNGSKIMGEIQETTNDINSLDVTANISDGNVTTVNGVVIHSYLSGNKADFNTDNPITVANGYIILTPHQDYVDMQVFNAAGNEIKRGSRIYDASTAGQGRSKAQAYYDSL